jgi:hypothetical protein
MKIYEVEIYRTVNGIQRRSSWKVLKPTQIFRPPKNQSAASWSEMDLGAHLSLSSGPRDIRKK